MASPPAQVTWAGVVKGQPPPAVSPGPSPRRAGVSAVDGKAQQHFEKSLEKRTEKKEEIVIVYVICYF
jgi:hypothetical protein